jgi:uncharacterized protein (DUF58 family)
VDTSDPKFRERFARAASDRNDALVDSLRRAGVDLFTLSTTDDVARALLSMVAHRRKRRRR